jgi:ubiquitin-conjugating enzyme E2 S
LKKDWNPAKWSLSNIFEVIKCLLIVPFPESSLNEEAGKQFMEDYSQFCETARVYSDVHAGKAPLSQPVIELNNAGAAEIEETK